MTMKKNHSDQLEEAVAWHLRLEDTAATDEDWRAFTQWLEASPEHRALYDDVEGFAREVASSQGPLLHAVTEISGKSDQTRGLLSGLLSVLARALRDILPRVDRGVWTRITAAATATAAVAVVAGMFILRGQAPDATFHETYRTAVGERRDVVLPDGSQIYLNTDSRISFLLSKDSRRAQFDQGEAIFEIAKDPQRPFSIAVGDQRVEVVGTKFNILRTAGQVSITVAEGVVQVKPLLSAPNGYAAERLMAGDRLVKRDGAQSAVRSKVDPSATFAWKGGRLVFDNAPLTSVVADLNRYFSPPIRIQDDATGTLRFSGVIRIEDQSAVLRRLAEFLPITVRNEPNEVILGPKSSDK